eukprot:3489492-Rhodomonas_salina.2
MVHIQRGVGDLSERIEAGEEAEEGAPLHVFAPPAPTHVHGSEPAGVTAAVTADCSHRGSHMYRRGTSQTLTAETEQT